MTSCPLMLCTKSVQAVSALHTYCLDWHGCSKLLPSAGCPHPATLMDAQGSGVRRFCVRARATGLLAVPGILVMSQAGGAPPLLSFDAVCRCTAWSHKAVGTLGAARSVSALGRGCSWEDSYGRGAGAESAAAELVRPAGRSSRLAAGVWQGQLSACNTQLFTEQYSTV